MNNGIECSINSNLSKAVIQSMTLGDFPNNKAFFTNIRVYIEYIE